MLIRAPGLFWVPTPFIRSTINMKVTSFVKLIVHSFKLTPPHSLPWHALSKQLVRIPPPMQIPSKQLNAQKDTSPSWYHGERKRSKRAQRENTTSTHSHAHTSKRRKTKANRRDSEGDTEEENHPSY